MRTRDLADTATAVRFSEPGHLNGCLVVAALPVVVIDLHRLRIYRLARRPRRRLARATKCNNH